MSYNFKRGWYSNRFKTKKDMEQHRDYSHQLNREMDQSRKERIEKRYGLNVRNLTARCIRVTDGAKRLDLFKDRYFKVDTGERGDKSDDYTIIEEYFNVKPKTEDNE